MLRGQTAHNALSHCIPARASVDHDLLLRRRVQTPGEATAASFQPFRVGCRIGSLCDVVPCACRAGMRFDIDDTALERLSPEHRLPVEVWTNNLAGHRRDDLLQVRVIIRALNCRALCLVVLRVVPLVPLELHEVLVGARVRW